MHSGEPLALTLASEHNLAFYLDQMQALRNEFDQAE
jgi:queuine/archaeosine tRNA-ribosyltransferase